MSRSAGSAPPASDTVNLCASVAVNRKISARASGSPTQRLGPIPNKGDCWKKNYVGSRIRQIETYDFARLEAAGGGVDKAVGPELGRGVKVLLAEVDAAVEGEHLERRGRKAESLMFNHPATSGCLPRCPSE